MADNNNNNNNNEPQGRQPVPPAKRRMLQQCFESGSKSSSKGDFDYATQMFTQCVAQDPANRVYAQNFLGNLQKKYNNDKKGAKFASVRGAGNKGAMKKSAMQKDWEGVVKSGLEFLKLNPWDVPTLTDMAAACEAMHCDETQVVYLQAAVEADLKDPETNRLLGRALGHQAQYEKAIICWQRVLQAKSSDPEARRAIADLTVEKTIHQGGYEDAETSTDVMADKQARDDRLGTGPAKLTPVQQLEKAIAKNPADVSKYVELGDLHMREERYAEAEEVFGRALQVSGGDVNMRERVEDVQLRRARQQIEIADKRLQTEKTPEAEALCAKLRQELNSKEMEVYRNRCERYPANLGFKYELGVRLEQAKNYKEAIKIYQEARNDPKRRGAVLLGLGRCFERIDQFKLASSNFEQAVAEISDRDGDVKKSALYRAGRLAYKLKELDKAEKHLTNLAGMDFDYRDVSELLDKIRRARDKEQGLDEDG